MDVVGVLATVTAAFLALAALRAIKRERRANFYLDQLVALGEAAWAEPNSKHPPRRVKMRIALLAPDYVPTAHGWCAESDFTLTEPFQRWQADSGAYRGDFEYWVRMEINGEIRDATERLLGERR
jgi:hypothetical protein